MADTVNGTITVVGFPLINSGFVGSPAGTLALAGTLPALGTFQTGDGPLLLSGVLTNTEQVLALNGATNTLTLQGGTVLGGTIAPTNGAAFIIQSGTLNGVTVDGVLDVGKSFNGALVMVTNGLTLNATALVGNSVNNSYGSISFAGSQTLGGSGQVVFGDNCCNNALWLSYPGTTLTIGGGITVHGQNGSLGSFSANPWSGPADVSVVNQGTLLADTANGTITVAAVPFTNLGRLGSPAGTLVLGGTLPGLGMIQIGHGPLFLSGVLTNVGQILSLRGVTNTLTLQGGTIVGGAIAPTNGAAFIVQNGTLDGVTVDGVLDVGNSFNGALVMVTNGLTLNGTALVGNPTNDSYGSISFEGSQTLGGNGSVVFGNNCCNNALWLNDPGTVLTVGSGITVQGQNGVLGSFTASPWAGPVDVGVINQGTIVADKPNGTITLAAFPFSNLGLVGSPVGTLMLAGTLPALGRFQTGNGPLLLSGILTNAGSTLSLNGATNTLALQGGTIVGGIVAPGNGAAFIVQSGTLDGVMLDGVLDVGNSFNGALLRVTNGLSLNGAALVGNPTNSSYGSISFAGSQTLGGNGTVVFGNNCCNNALWLNDPATTLTIGRGITVQGQNGVLGSFSASPWSGPANVGLLNQGAISADIRVGTVTVSAEPFNNQGIVLAGAGNVVLPAGEFQNSGTLEATNGGALQVPPSPSIFGEVIALAGGVVSIPDPVYLDGLDFLSSQPGGTILLAGNVLGTTTNSAQFTPLGSTILNGPGTAASPQELEVMSADLGAAQAGFEQNFDYGTLLFTNETFVLLVDQHQNSGSAAPEALYANTLVVAAGATLNLNGFHAYTLTSHLRGTILNGAITRLGNGGASGGGDPWLSMVLTNQTQVLFSWPTNAANFCLQSAASPGDTANWLAVTNARTTNSSAVQVVVPLTTANQFFRLMAQ